MYQPMRIGIFGVAGGNKSMIVATTPASAARGKLFIGDVCIVVEECVSLAWRRWRGGGIRTHARALYKHRQRHAAA